MRAYQLLTVTYGLVSAPYLAIRTLQQLAHDEAHLYPIGAKTLMRDMYVDDVLAGEDTIEAALIKQRQLSELLMAGGFPLRKWTSNSPTLLSHLPPDNIAASSCISWQTEPTYLTLGLTWQPNEDIFIFQVKPPKDFEFNTKRTVLSKIAQLFDPLGWLAPVTVTAKILLQSLWLHKLNWDDPLPDREAQEWITFQSEMQHLSTIHIPRWLGISSVLNLYELHGFADASERAYAAALYIRVYNERGISRVTLITAKTKVAPLQQISVPRLQLCAATLVVRLTARIRTTLHLEDALIHLWPDPTVTLAWIRSHPKRWKTYVANRVSEIQQSLPDAHWHHVATGDNPADCASRGIAASNLASSDLWWHGPYWLTSVSSPWQASAFLPEPSETPEKRVMSHAIQIKKDNRWNLLERYSTLSKLPRVTAYCFRFVTNLRSRLTATGEATTVNGPCLTPGEINRARLFWVRQVQLEAFPDEIASLSSKRPLAAKGDLAKLAPFLDEQRLLRVGGRLKHSILSPDERHPLILPRNSHLTELIIKSCHQRE